MTDFLNTTVKVGDLEFATIQMEDFLPLPPIYTQRNSEARVGKMKPTFDGAYLNNRADTLAEVAIGIAEKDIIDPETGNIHPKGTISILDACTRQHYWKLNPETQKHHSNGLTARLHRLYNHEDVEAAYYPYNNAKSAENKADVIQGLNRRYNFTPRQTVFANGTFGSALNYASTNPKDRNERPDVFEQYEMNFDALKRLDSIPKGSKYGITKPAIGSIKSQAIIGACLVALRSHPGNVNVLAFIEQLSTIEFEDLERILNTTKEANPVEMVALEYTGFSEDRNGRHKRVQTQPWLNNAAGSTKIADVTPQMNFVLYQISQYINSPNSRIDITSVKPNAWDKEWENWY